MVPQAPAKGSVNEALVPQAILSVLTSQRARYQLPFEPRLDVSTCTSVPRDLSVAATDTARQFISWKLVTCHPVPLE